MTVQGRYYSMKAAAAGEGEILLYSEIGGGGGLFSDPGTNAEDFARDLKALGKVKTINCRINSPGGSVFEGMTIYNLLAAHPAKVVVHVDGLAASIASVIAMAGDTINIADNAMIMIHDAWGVGVGTADEISKTAEVLDSITATIAKTYAKRASADAPKIRADDGGRDLDDRGRGQAGWPRRLRGRQHERAGLRLQSALVQERAGPSRRQERRAAGPRAVRGEVSAPPDGLASRPLRRPPRGALKPGPLASSTPGGARLHPLPRAGRGWLGVDGDQEIRRAVHAGENVGSHRRRKRPPLRA